GADVRLGSCHHPVAHRQPDRGEDVALLTVAIVNEGDTRTAVRVVLDGRDPTRNADLAPLEVDDAVQLLVTAAAMTDGDASPHVAAAVLLEVLDQRLLRFGARHLLEAAHRHESAAGTGWLVLLGWHCGCPRCPRRGPRSSGREPASRSPSSSRGCGRRCACVRASAAAPCPGR